ncbi:MAG: lysozyme [Hyphomonadaceae bacterium]|nr:lysozyme [Hyphomonadaceae bacterium]
MIAKTVSSLGLQRIQAFEGFQGAPMALADGRFIYGHGHVAMSAPQAQVTRAQAAELLKSDLAPAERAVNAMVRVALSQSQFDSLVSFAYSIGVANFAKCETLRRVNAGEFAAAGCAMDAWRKSAVSGQSEVVEALVRRRAQERAMLTEGFQGVPSALLAAEMDHAAAILAAPVRIAALPGMAQVEPMTLTVSAPRKADPMAMLRRACDFVRRCAAEVLSPVAKQGQILPQT